MESKRTETSYFIPSGKFLLMENALGNPDLIQSSVSADCRVTIVDKQNFPLDELEQWPTFRLVSSDIKLKLGEGAYHIYIVVPTPDNAETITAFVSYHTSLVDRDGFAPDGKQLGKTGFKYYACGTVSARGGNPSVQTVPAGQGRSIEVDLGVTPAPSTLPGDLNDFDKIFQLDKVDPNNPKSWLLTILATVKSMTARLVRITGSLVFGSGESEKTVTDVALSSQADDQNSVSDTILPTTAWVTARFQTYGEHFLRKDQDDRSVGRISTDKGFEAGRFVSGFLGGTGAWIGADGYGEMSGLTLREFLEVPELRFNRIDVVSGELWNAVAFGMVEEVDTENRICKIKLEENERCGLHVGDFCRGIFADFSGGNNWEDEDECRFMHLYGFSTSYFTPKEILDNEEGLFRFEYELKPDTTQHPTQSMKFAVYGHPKDKSRQASAYATRTYKRYLNNVDTWVIEPDRHIYAQYGDLNGLQIDGVKMQGYGSFQSNAYFRGVQIQLPPEQMESLKGDSAYAAQLTSYIGTVKLDADGNMIGGISEETNVTALDENGVVSNVTALDESGVERYVVVTTNKLTTTVQAYKGSTPLYYSSAAVKGGFTLSLDCVGCTASVVNGAIIINSITDTKDCRINITVNCEGMAVYNLEYNVVFVQDGKNGQNVSMYEISPGTNIIKETSSGVEPSTISFTSWKREGGSRIKFTARWIVFGWKDSKVGQGTILNDLNTWSNSYTYDFSVRIKEGYKYFEVKTDDATFELATSEVVVVKDGGKGENGADAVSYRIEPNIQTISKTMTGTLSPESVRFMLQANKGGVIKYYPTVWSLKGRNLANGEWTTLKTADSTTSFDVVFTANYKYYELSAKTYGDGDVMLGDTLNISIVADGKNGEDGASGAMPRYRGEFVFNNESEPYVYDSEYRDIVLYDGNVFQVYKYGDSVTDPPTVPTNSDNDGKWQIANKMRFVAMDTALVDNANIGGFTFARKKYLNGAPVGVMRSQYGPICISSVDKAVSSGTQVGMTINNLVTKYITIRKFNDAVYELVPSTLKLVRRKNDDDVYVHDTATVSCSVKTTGTGGSGYTLKYSKDGGLETTGNSVSTSGVTSNITFILYSNNVEVGRQVIPVLDDGSTAFKAVVEKETLCLKVDENGEIESGLPFRVKAYLYKGANEVSITSLNISTPSGVEAVNELIEIDTESGTLKCTNVNLTGTINAVSGNIGDWNIENGELVVSGIGDFESLRDTSYTNRIDMSGLHVDYGNGGIFADIGINYITFNAENQQYFSAINLRNTQGLSRRSDDMCGIYVSGSDPDIGILVEGCASSHLRSSIGTHIWGLTLNQRIVTSTGAMNPNDDVILFDNTSNIEFTFSGKASVGKVVFMKRGNNSTGSVKLKGSIRTGDSRTGAINTERTLGTWSAMYVKTDVYWTEFYCG